MTTIAPGQLIETDWINQWSPPGMVTDYAGAVAPDGWLLCDGASYLRSAYPALFAVVGTTYGSADGTHFNVPDCRGRVPVGYAVSGGHADVATLGGNDGVAAANRRPKHNHDVTTPPAIAVATSVNWIHSGSNTTTGIPYTDTQVGSHDVGTIPITASASGGAVGPGGAAPVDAPAYIVLNKIIRAKDL